MNIKKVSCVWFRTHRKGWFFTEEAILSVQALRKEIRITRRIKADSEKTFGMPISGIVKRFMTLRAVTIVVFDGCKFNWMRHPYMSPKKNFSAFRSLHAHLPFLFTYQRHPHLHIPNTTNSPDGSFGKLKQLLNVHCGLTTQRRYRLIQEILSYSSLHFFH